MNLYLISQEENNDYDTYDSAVVCAESEDAARDTYPGKWKERFPDDNRVNWLRKKPLPDWMTGEWCKNRESVKVKYLGKADDSIPAGVVCASYNAG